MELHCEAAWIFFVFSQVLIQVSGHGKMVDPPGRNTVMNTQRSAKSNWKQCNTGPINYSDKSNFCGGKQTQEDNDGKCSACGDDWAKEYPREHDYSGMFAQEITPVRAYLQGQTITVKVLITASHQGYFEFRLCPKLEGENGDDELTQCYMDPSQYRQLQLTDGAIRAEGISQAILYSFDVKLPKDVNCVKGCSLQWWYKTGNSWGCDPDGTCGLGKGPQEHFVNCADILILNCDQYQSGNYPDWCGYGPTETLKDCAKNANRTQTSGETETPDSEAEEDKSESIDEESEESNQGSNSPSQDMQQETTTGIAKTPLDSGESWEESPGGWSPEYPEVEVPPASMTCEECYRAGQVNCDQCCETNIVLTYTGTTKVFDNWCQANCQRGYCPKSHCRVSEARQFRQTCDIPVEQNDETTVAPSCEECQERNLETCENLCCERVSTKIFKGYQSRFDRYCQNNCAVGFCPRTYCYVRDAMVWKDMCNLGSRHVDLKDILQDLVEDFEKNHNLKTSE